MDSAGNVYVADTGSGTIRRMTPAGVVTTLVGAPGQHVVTPGPLPGRLNGPVGITIAPNGDLLVVDSNESDLLRVH